MLGPEGFIHGNARSASGTCGEDISFLIASSASRPIGLVVFDADYADERRIVADKRRTAVTGHAYLRQSAVHLRNPRSGCWADRHDDACLPQERPLRTHSLKGINNKIDVPNLFLPMCRARACALGWTNKLCVSRSLRLRVKRFCACYLLNTAYEAH